MADRDTLAVLAEELALALAPLTDAVQDEDAFAELMRNLGWDMASIPSALAGLQAPTKSVSETVQGGETDADSAPALLQAIGSALSAISNTGSATGLPGTVDATQFVAEFPRQLVDYLAVEYLLDYQPRIGELLKLVGVIRLVEVPVAGLRTPFVRRVIAWEDVAKVFDDPAGIFRNAYRFGQPDFDQEAFVENVADAAEAFGIETLFDRIPDAVATVLMQGSTATNPYRGYVRAPLLGSALGNDEIEAGVGVYPLPDAGAAKPAGFAVLPYAHGQFEQTIDIAEHVAIVLEGAFDAAGGVGILIRPDQLDVLFDLLSGTPAVGGELGLGVAVQGTEGEPIVVAGSRDASHIEFRSVSLMGGVRTASGGLDAFVELDLQGGRIVVKPGGDSDSFLASLLPADGLVIDVALLVGLSSKQGIYFGGSGGLEISLPAHIQLGPIEIVSATLAIKPKAGILPLEAGATIKGELGPLKAVVENIGLRVELSFPANRDGNLGTANLALGFKPPNGVGLSIDAGVVKGGGYLFIDVDRGEYAGALELTVADFLSLKAIGLIATKNPDGTPGFSLLVIITAEFGSGLQLGYGFVLIGVGGLLGLNRTMRLEPLMLGVRTGAINGIMFPTDIVANAPRIISDLRTIFPAKQGTFLIGPMVKLGWGAGLISLAVGVIIEIPGNVAIIGVLKLALPDADDPVVVIQANFAGAIEFDKKRGYFFAALFESRVLTMTLEGEMGMLIAVGDDANFVVSVGGFHPSFKPPPLPFPSPKRLALSILNEDNARIRAETYFAITTNTVQFGAQAELYFGFSAFALEGHFGFDALLRFSPLYFIIEVSASVSLKAFGVGCFSIRVHLALEGPTPWRARGTGSISLLFWSLSADFDVTWGDVVDTLMPAIEVLELLAGELAKNESWRALLPDASNLMVSLRQLEDAAATLVLHPLGTLRLSQKSVPLDLTVARVGAQRPSDANRFALNVTGGGLAKLADASESFAGAQFLDLDDAAKLSRPAYERQHGGVDLAMAGEQYASAHAVARVVRYEEIIIDTAWRRRARRFRDLAVGLFDHFLGGNAASRSALSQRGKDERQPFADVIKTGSEGYVVANRSDNTTVQVFDSEAMAQDALASTDVMAAQELHVIPASEALAA
ncbi:MAG: hypothetical protein V7607_1237 [Solirubrobacteraceae bacterium]